MSVCALIHGNEAENQALAAGTRTSWMNSRRATGPLVAGSSGADLGEYTTRSCWHVGSE